MSSFFYKYLAVKSLLKGKKTPLYFSRFFFRIYRSLPILLRLAMTSFRFFHLFYKSCYSLIHLKFWLLALNHFVVFYKSVYIIRITLEYLSINVHQSNKFLKTIYYLIEPYYKIVHLIFSSGLAGNIIGFYIIWILAFFSKKLAWIVLRYQNSSTSITEVNLLLQAALDEKIVFN